MISRNLLPFLLALCLHYSASGQYKDLVQNKIDPETIPPQITSLHQQKFPGSFVTSWELHKAPFLKNTPEEGTYFVSTFSMHGRQGHKAFYHPKEGYLASVSYVAPYNLPELVQVQATQYLQDEFIKYGQIIELKNPNVFLYRLKINNNGLLEYHYFDKYGRPVDKKNISPKVFSFI